MWRLLAVWQAERHEYRIRDKRPLPRLDKYIDLPADSLALLTRLALGAVAAGLLHGQITGLVAAVATGAAAPAVLLQLGSAKALAGTDEMPPPAESVVKP